MSEFKLLVCGSRTFEDYDFLKLVMNKIFSEYELYNYDVEIISGHCSGADKLAEIYAQENNIPIYVCEAQWKLYGKSAGPRRNKEMIDYISGFSNNLVVAFVSPNSVGTLNTIKLAEKSNIPVVRVDYEESLLSQTLDEGIRVDETGNVVFDWNNDNETDIIQLHGEPIHKGKFYGNVQYYGYRITAKKSKEKSDLLKHIKYTMDDNVLKLVNDCVDAFTSLVPANKIDHIIVVPSSGKVNSVLYRSLAKHFRKASLIEASKKPSADAEIDEDALRLAAGDDEDKYNRLKQGTEELVNNIRKSGEFSSHKANKHYVDYIKPMISIDEAMIENNKECNLLIVDDIRSDGTTMKMMISALQDIGFEGSITIFNLIYNRS